MTETLNRPDPLSRGLSRTTTLAVVVFLTVYAATLVVLFAPKDVLGVQPGSLAQPED